jgi:hypothetical protein
MIKLRGLKMAKHKHREQDSMINDTNAKMNTQNTPFGIDPMQLMGLLGGNFDMNNMGNMLASMNTNGFNLGNLNSIAQMMGLNLDNNLFQQNSNNRNNDINKNMYSNVNQNMKEHSNTTNSKSADNSNIEKSNKKNATNRNIREDDVNLEFLMALRSYAHPDRIGFIDNIIEAYKSGKI